MNGRTYDFFYAQLIQQDGGSHNIHNGICSPYLMKVYFFYGVAVYGRFCFGYGIKYLLRPFFCAL